MAFERISPLIAQHPQNLIQAQVAAYQQGNAQRNAKLGNVSDLLQAIVSGYTEKKNREMQMGMADKQMAQETSLQDARLGKQGEIAEGAQGGETERLRMQLATSVALKEMTIEQAQEALKAHLALGREQIQSGETIAGGRDQTSLSVAAMGEEGATARQGASIAAGASEAEKQRKWATGERVGGEEYGGYQNAQNRAIQLESVKNTLRVGLEGLGLRGRELDDTMKRHDQILKADLDKFGRTEDRLDTEESNRVQGRKSELDQRNEQFRAEMTMRVNEAKDLKDYRAATVGLERERMRVASEQIEAERSKDAVALESADRQAAWVDTMAVLTDLREMHFSGAGSDGSLVQIQGGGKREDIARDMEAGIAAVEEIQGNMSKPEWVAQQWDLARRAGNDFRSLSELIRDLVAFKIKGHGLILNEKVK